MKLTGLKCEKSLNEKLLPVLSHWGVKHITITMEQDICYSFCVIEYSV